MPGCFKGKIEKNQDHRIGCVWGWGRDIDDNLRDYGKQNAKHASPQFTLKWKREKWR